MFIIITKIILFLLAAIFAGYVLIHILSSPPARVTRSWQTITINGIGTFKVPTEWSVDEEDGILYLTDRPRAYGVYTIYIVGVLAGSGTQPHEVFEGVEKGDLLHSSAFGNNVIVSLIEYTVAEITQEHPVISFDRFRGGEMRGYRMFVWNFAIVDEWYTEQIARTFRINHDEFDNPNFGRLVQ